MKSGKSVGISCRCGSVRGQLHPAGSRYGLAAICYCRDCQAAAHYLEKPELLDAHGGSHLLITAPRMLELSADALGCFRFSPRGPRRWYTTCCRTPIGNTLGDLSIPFLSLQLSCVPDQEREQLAEAEHGIHMRDARNPPPLKHGCEGSSRRLGLRVAWNIAREKLLHAGAPSPFADADGNPAVAAEIVPREQRQELLGRAGFGAT